MTTYKLTIAKYSFLARVRHLGGEPCFADRMPQRQAGSSNTLTDANIAAILVNANKIDISAGKIVLARSDNEKIEKIAQQMVTDYTAVLDSAVELVTKLGVTPVNNDLVAMLAK